MIADLQFHDFAYFDMRAEYDAHPVLRDIDKTAVVRRGVVLEQGYRNRLIESKTVIGTSIHATSMSKALC